MDQGQHLFWTIERKSEMPSAGNSLFSLQKAHNLSIAQPTELRNIGLSD